MKTCTGLVMIMVYISAGLCLSINLGITHGAKGYFIGALVGFGGSIIVGAVVISIISKCIHKK